MRKKLPRTLTQEQVKAILGYSDTGTAKGRRDQAILSLMYYCGLRVGEVVAIRDRDIDWTGNKLTVIDGKNGKDRMIPTFAGKPFKALWEHRKGLILQPQDFLFASDSGSGHISTRCVQRMIKKACPQATPHMLRHTYATELIRDGVPLALVSDRLGHENVSTTMIYVHLAGVVHDAELARLG